MLLTFLQGGLLRLRSNVVGAAIIAALLARKSPTLHPSSCIFGEPRLPLLFEFFILFARRALWASGAPLVASVGPAPPRLWLRGVPPSLSLGPLVTRRVFSPVRRGGVSEVVPIL